MYLLGLTGGRKMGNSEILLRAALMGAKEVGVDIELIRLMDLNIKPPLGESTQHLKVRDHTAFINKKIRDCDGLILSCPAYVLTPPGFVLNIRDKTALRGLPLKIRPAGMIAVGGSDWTSLMLPLMYTCLPNGECKIVDQMLLNFTAPLSDVILKDEAIARARKLGKNVAEAMKIPIEKVEYLSEEPWACPLCHQNLLIIRGKQVECSICDVRGTIEMTKDGLKVNYTKEALQNYRWGPGGAKRHGDVIKAQVAPHQAAMPEITKRLKAYEDFITPTRPPEEIESSGVEMQANQQPIKKTLLDV